MMLKTKQKRNKEVDQKRWKEYYPQHREEFRKYHRDYYKAHREEIRKHIKEARLQSKVEVFSHYSNGIPRCATCGILDIDVLCIDHLNSGGLQHRQKIKKGSGYAFYAWLKKNNYPSEYQVLCANCNLKKQMRRLRGETEEA